MSLTLVPKPAATDPGYFRIGDVILAIPPESIRTRRLTNNEEVVTLRAGYPMYKKTGHERLDVTVSWKALVDYSSGAPDYSQWEDVRREILDGSAYFLGTRTRSLLWVFAYREFSLHFRPLRPK